MNERSTHQMLEAIAATLARVHHESRETHQVLAELVEALKLLECQNPQKVEICIRVEIVQILPYPKTTGGSITVQ